MKNRIFYLSFGLVLIALIFSLFKIQQRIKIEKLNQYALIAVDYEDAMSLANLEGQKIEAVLKTFWEAGSRAVVLREDTLFSLEKEGRLSLYSGAELLNLRRFVYFDWPVITDKSASYIIINDFLLLQRIRNFLALELSESKVTFVANNTLEVKAGKYQILDLKRKTTEIELEYDARESLGNIGLGLDPKKARMLKEQGFFIIAGLIPSHRISADGIKEKIKLIKSASPDISVSFFEDDYVSGWPGNISATAAAFLDYNLSLGLVELNDQKGGTDLGQLIKNSVIPIHAITRPETRLLSETSMVNRFIRAARERGQKILYLHLLFRRDLNPDLIALNSDYIKQIKIGLKNQAIEAEKSLLIPMILYPATLKYSFLESVFYCLAALTGAFWLLKLLKFEGFWTYLVLLIFGPIFLLTILPEYESIGQKSLALAAAVIFASLAATSPFKLPQNKKFWLDLVWRTALCLFFSLTGGFLVAGILAEPNFLLKLDQFSGVKLFLFMPFAIFLVFIKNNFFSKTSLAKFLKEISGRPINVFSLELAVLGGAGLFFYFIRSGNQFRQAVPQWELTLRDILEKVLVARPRTKEVFLGYPALFFAFIFFKKYQRLFWFWLVALVGCLVPVSIINSFAHVHTPFILTLLRVFNGFWLGCFVFLVYFSVFKFFKKYL